MSETRTVVGAVRSDEAERTVADLTTWGFESEILVPAPGRYVLEDGRLHEEASSAVRWALIAAVIGALIGVVVALAVPSVRVHGAGLQWALAIGFGGFAILPGIVIGLQASDHFDDDPARWLEVDDGAPLRFVVARGPSEGRAHRILTGHGGIFVDPHELAS